MHFLYRTGKEGGEALGRGGGMGGDWKSKEGGVLCPSLPSRLQCPYNELCVGNWSRDLISDQEMLSSSVPGLKRTLLGKCYFHLSDTQESASPVGQVKRSFVRFTTVKKLLPLDFTPVTKVKMT